MVFVLHFLELHKEFVQLGLDQAFVSQVRQSFKHSVAESLVLFGRHVPHLVDFLRPESFVSVQKFKQGKAFFDKFGMQKLAEKQLENLVGIAPVE